MSKTEKELAFLQDLYVTNDWTERFTSLIGGKLDTSEAETVLYINAGTGNFALSLEEKLDEDIELVCVCENEELLTIARAKADAIKAGAVFRVGLPAEKFDAVLADASFTRPADLRCFVAEVADRSKDKTVFFLPTAGSFGEIFSYFWHTLLELGWLEKGARVENLITELPTVSGIEEIAQNIGLVKVNTTTKNEVFEFENGTEFVNSPLVADFLFPAWLEFLTEDEIIQFSEKLVQTIDAENEGLSFRFAVKTTLVTGEKG